MSTCKVVLLQHFFGETTSAFQVVCHRPAIPMLTLLTPTRMVCWISFSLDTTFSFAYSVKMLLTPIRTSPTMVLFQQVCRLHTWTLLGQLGMIMIQMDCRISR